MEIILSMDSFEYGYEKYSYNFESIDIIIFFVSLQPL